MDIDGYKLCALGIGYVMPSTRTVFCRKELREKARIRLFLGLKSAHTDRLFVVISCEKISERFYIAAKVSVHEPIFNLWQRYSVMSNPTHQMGSQCF